MNNSKNQLHNQKHLTLSDRTFIEQELQQESTFSYIAQALRKDPTTISKEVRLHRIFTEYNKYRSKCRGCMYYGDCLERHVCGLEKCKYACRYCYKKDPTPNCIFYRPWKCDKPSKPPYVCNSCNRFNTCKLDKYQYVALKAQNAYEKDLSKSRTGINMTPEELLELNDLISPLILKGQPLSHIFAVHADEIPVCRRTLYNYLDQRIFQARNIDLPRRVRYKKRKKFLLLVHRKTFNRYTATNELMLILSDLWMLILILMLLKWIL